MAIVYSEGLATGPLWFLRETIISGVNVDVKTLVIIVLILQIIILAIILLRGRV